MLNSLLKVFGILKLQFALLYLIVDATGSIAPWLCGRCIIAFSWDTGLNWPMFSLVVVFLLTIKLYLFQVFKERNMYCLVGPVL